MNRRFTSKSIFLTLATALVMLLYGQNAMAQYVQLTALNGTGGDGNAKEGFTKLVDMSTSTKWGHFFDPEAPTDPSVPTYQEAWIIVKAETAVVPTNYFLVTGNDTGVNPGRNWENWNIYGANFTSDEEAIRGAEGWVLIDKRENEPMPAKNFAEIEFEFNQADGTPYKYYMIEITRTVEHAYIYMQMSEFGLGKYQDLMSADSAPLTYTAIDGNKNDPAQKEGLQKLFDGDQGTKWGETWVDGEPKFAIFKTSRPVAPTYYKLTEGNDTGKSPDRNWKSWCIYGLEESDESKVNRDAEGWVLLDERVDVSREEFPAINYYKQFFKFNKENTTKYKYFKIEVNSIWGSGGTYMQMADISLGTDAQFEDDKVAFIGDAITSIDTTKPCQKTVLEQLLAVAEKLQNLTDAGLLNSTYNELNALKDVFVSSVAAYENYGAIIDAIKVHFDTHECITGEGRTIIGNYLNTEAEPTEEFSNGTYPYIMKNLLLDNEQLRAEGIFANSLLETYASDITEGALPEDLVYTPVDGTKTNVNEGPGFLFDEGGSATKWCTTNNASVFVIFSTSEPIAPTYYRMTTANDTKTGDNEEGGRNWKTWKIYGANFDSEEAAKNREASEWVLIDSKSNIGKDQLTSENFTDVYFNLSNPSQTKFQYFRIEIESMQGTKNKQQMSDFEFGNDANRILARNAAYDEYALYLEDEFIAQKSLIEEYKAQLKNLKMCASVTDMIKYTTVLTSLQTQIEASITAYVLYEDAVSLLEGTDFSVNAQAEAWATGYVSSNEGPNGTFLRGTRAYIMENLLLSTEELDYETSYLNSMIKAAEDGTSLICLGGFANSTGAKEDWRKLIDGNYDTKWYSRLTEEGGYIIFRSLEPINPFFYTLNTGGDTESFPGRNWGTWHIYGANFAGDGEATADAEGWVLVDAKENIGQDRLHPTNKTASYFGFSTETTEKYTYYKIHVAGPYIEGNGIQMQELVFGTEERFAEIKDSFQLAANEFDYNNMIAEQRLLTDYENTINGIDECQNMEVLFRINYALEQMRDSITASAAVYDRYIKAVEANDVYLQDNILTECNAVTIFQNYITGDGEPSELYPNGQAQYIKDMHELADSVVEDEIVFMESLKKAAVAAGYTAGNEITSLIVNPTFAQGSEGWSQELLGYQTDNTSGMTAAEMVREMAVFDLNQTVSGLKNGYYKVKLNAAFRPGTDDIYSYNYSALAYANGIATYVPVVREYMVAKDDVIDGVNCSVANCHPIELVNDMNEVIDTLGYVPWYKLSCCTAFNYGLYELTLVTKVTDGNLTFGLKNDGTPQGGDWCGFGDFKLYYLGEEADAASLEEAAACNAARIETLENSYVPMDILDPTYKTAPHFGQAQLEALKALKGKAEYAALEEATAIFEDINTNKHAHVALNVIKNKIYDKWFMEMNDDEVGVLMDDVFEVEINMAEGLYANTAATLEAKTQLYTKYPDYLAINEEKAIANVEYERTAPFTYDLTANGARPNIALSGLYEDIDSTRCILAIDYKAAQNLTDGEFYFAAPALDTNQKKTVGELEATAGEDWKTMYWDITDAIKEWGFGKTDCWLRWDLSVAGGEGLTISISKARLITKAQMEAAGGNINAIDKVQDGTATVTNGIFTISGVRVQKAQKGLYIINGKKVLVK